MKNYNILFSNKITYCFLFLSFIITLASCKTTTNGTLPETALKTYLDNKDKSFSWQLKATNDADEYKVYELELISQQWREYKWKHRLSLIVPDELNYNGSLLFITGGKNENKEPVVRKHDERFIESMAAIARRNQAIVSIIWQVPNQPLYDKLSEDALISYTLHNFRKDGDYSWPLLFPMVKSVVKAMDAVQAFSMEVLEHEIDEFVLTGASKRGWTTWLTGAIDPRVEAIAPMVIDVLNMPVNLDYQIKTWQSYSAQIADYVSLEIPQQVGSDTGIALTTMIDPYSYRQALTMPKMIFIGTNDEYWPVDAIKHYIDSIPGENYLHYVANAGHGLGDGKQVFTALSVFFGKTLTGKYYNKCSWEISETEDSVLIEIETSPNSLSNAVLWIADSVEDRDFRDETWTGNNIKYSAAELIKANVKLPEEGYRAFYVDLVYKDAYGDEYSKSTRLYVINNEGILVD